MQHTLSAIAAAALLAAIPAHAGSLPTPAQLAGAAAQERIEQQAYRQAACDELARRLGSDRVECGTADAVAIDSDEDSGAWVPVLVYVTRAALAKTLAAR
jgi:hypothetical protein